MSELAVGSVYKLRPSADRDAILYQRDALLDHYITGRHLRTGESLSANKNLIGMYLESYRTHTGYTYHLFLISEKKYFASAEWKDFTFEEIKCL